MKEVSRVLKGKVRASSGNALHMRCGLESYFMPQNEGKPIERDLDNVSAEVSVDGSGRSAIPRLFIAGKEVRFY